MGAQNFSLCTGWGILKIGKPAPMGISIFPFLLCDTVWYPLGIIGKKKNLILQVHYFG